MDLLTTFYVEAYKKRMFDEIPIGVDSDGNNFYLTSKQVGALERLHDSDTLFLGYGGSARCCGSGTYVRTNNGLTQINEINVGDLVLSYSDNGLVYNQVLDKFEFDVNKYVLDINGLILTNEHKVLFRGEWAEIEEFRRRIMETRFRPIYDFKYGENRIYKLLRTWKVAVNETIIKGWLRKAVSVFGLPKEEKFFSTSVGCGSVHPEPEWARASKPPEFCKDGQSGRELGMVYERSEHRTRDDKLQEKEEVNPCKSFKDSGIVRLWNENATNIKRIVSFLWLGSRCYSRRNVVARELTFSEIKNSVIRKYKGKVYDLEVENTHSYCVTEDNIIIHNSGKTLLECFWMVFQCLSYPGVAYGLGRKELSTLRKTALITLFELLGFYSLVDGKDYRYYEQKNKIEFSNGSVIFLIDMVYQPSDPLYTRFGGLELTGAAVDESNESDINAIGTLFSRCGWKKNVEYGIKKKMLETFNPDKSHVYSRYYSPFRDGKESDARKFIPALPSDNPHPAIKEWIQDMIAEGDNNRIQRLVYGNFDFDDNPDSLVDYPAICDIFGNDHVKGGTKYISTDLAMQGHDSFVGISWNGLIGTISIDNSKANAKTIETDLKKLMQKHCVYNSNVVSDADGLGNYLSSYIRNIKTFRGNARPVNRKDYGNLKDECGWKLAEMINKRAIKIICTPKQEERLKQELSVCLRRDNLDSDTQKKKLIKKAEAKKQLGFSPDYYDTLMMRMIFELKRTGKQFRVKAY